MQHAKPNVYRPPANDAKLTDCGTYRNLVEHLIPEQIYCVVMDPNCVIIRLTMPWSTAPSSLYLAAGQANQIAFGFADVWAGPQYATAKLDRAEGGTVGGLKILVVQWQGTATDGNVALGLPPKSYYLLGVNNTSDSNIWFHLEGGRAA
jgi:hypothetical protein